MEHLLKFGNINKIGKFKHFQIDNIELSNEEKKRIIKLIENDLKFKNQKIEMADYQLIIEGYVEVKNEN